ncbi:Protein TIFY 10A, partial [Linum perenne]
VNIIINYRRRRKEKTPSLSLSLSTIPPFIFLLSPELLVPFFSILHFTLLHIFQNTKSRNTEQTPIASIVVLNFRLFRSFLYSISSSLKFSQRIMSSSPEFVEFAAEKPSFSQKCSMLSHYFKETGNFGDLTLGIMTSAADAHPSYENDMLRYSPVAAAVTLFPLSNGHTPDSNQMGGCPLPPPPPNQQPMNLFPQKAGFYDSPKLLQTSNNKPTRPTSQLTIFYGGQVVVFNDFPADKAEEVMLLASRGSCKSPTAAINTQPTFSPLVTAKTPIASSTTSVASPVTPTSDIVTSFSKNMSQDCVQVQQAPKPITCDLPIARRASLHRFLEKRKDRITARAPYQISNGPSSLSQGQHTTESKLGSAESNSWLGLISQSPPSTNC